MKFSAKITKYEDSQLLNICDLEILGEKLEEGNLRMNIGRYYEDVVVEETESKKLLEESQIINMCGKNIVRLALEANVGAESGVKRISGVPFLLVFKI